VAKPTVGSDLPDSPPRYHLYEKEPWHSKGLRVWPIDNYLKFYLPVEAKTLVTVIRISYGGRDIEEQLWQTEAGR
jgi:toxin ParE1/3/4